MFRNQHRFYSPTAAPKHNSQVLFLVIGVTRSVAIDNNGFMMIMPMKIYFYFHCIGPNPKVEKHRGQRNVL